MAVDGATGTSASPTSAAFQDDAAAIERIAAGVRRSVGEFAPASPLYARLATAAADRPEMLTPLLAAPPTQGRALLLFAAVAYLLRTEDPHHPLADWYPVLGGRRPATDGDPVGALGDFIDAHRTALGRLCATRRTQTNEVRRAALLRPAFGRAAEIASAADIGRGGRTGELSLIELGTSAGLLLATDRYTVTYRGRERTETYHDGSLRIDCDLRGPDWPSPAATEVRVFSRTGIDLAPIEPFDADGAVWLHACIWPEHTDRDARLDLALAEVARLRPTMIAADMREGLASAVAAVPDGVMPCVFMSHALIYLDRTERTELVRSLAAIGSMRDLVVVMNEPAPLNLWSEPVAQIEPGVTTHVSVIAWRGGAASVEVLAEGDAHGRWLRYEPRVYAFGPPALSGSDTE
jgi:hypothetical protein